MRKIIALLLAAVVSTGAAARSLWEMFETPGHEARTKLWWFHGETETTREGIDADLQAFKDAGIGGVVFYDQVHGEQTGACAALSPQWWEMLKYAARRAKELGLSFEMAASNGYVCGGPWITPDLGMQKIVVVRPGDETPAGFTELLRIDLPSPGGDTPLDTLVSAGRLTLLDNQSAVIDVDFGVPRTVRTISYEAKPRGKGSFGSMNVSAKPSPLYSGAGYVHLPPIGTLESSEDGENWTVVTDLPGIEDVIGHKSRQRTMNFPAVTARRFRINLHDWQGEGNRRLEVDKVRLMGYDMTDNWEEKSGLRSEIARRPYDLRIDEPFIPFSGKAVIGYAPTKGQAKHGRSRIVYDGKELSSRTWLEADVLNRDAVKTHYDNYFKAVLDTLAAIGCAPCGMAMDSHEAGVANWTAEMPAHFRRLRGYDITPWLPALGGYIVESRAATEGFLRDFRRTVSDLVSEQFYGTLASLCRRDGVSYTTQAMLGCCNDNIASRGCADKPQGEFWAYQKDGNYDVLDAASAAHLYGRRIASGEAFTDTPYFYPADSADTGWKERGWAELRRIANIAYCRGVNEFVVCASTYQPWPDRKYDDDASAHPYIFHRHNLAWDKSRENFWEYQARCSSMLQAGRPVVDILVYLGDDVPAKTLAYKLPDIPEGYRADVATAASLRHLIDNPSDLSPDYKVLAVQDRSSITPESEQMIAELARRGMIIVRCDRGRTLAEALQEAGLAPDIEIKSRNEVDDMVHFCHRLTDEADIYFIYNHSREAYTAPIRLRVASTDIELWDPLTLERSRSAAGQTLTLAPYSSIFIIAHR